MPVPFRHQQPAEFARLVGAKTMLTVKELSDLLDGIPPDFEVLVCGASVEVVFASKHRSRDPDLPNVVSLEEKACAIDPDNNDYAVLWTYDDEAVLS